MSTDIRVTPLSTYFVELDAGRFDAVMAVFDDSCIYVRPPAMAHGSGSGMLRTFQGKVAVREFLDARGVLSLVHNISVSSSDGRDCFVEGTSTRTTPTGTEQTLFMAHAVLNANNLITRFVALSAALERPRPSSSF